MNKNKMTKLLLLAMGLSFATTSLSALAANVPAGTKLAKVQELVRGNGTEVSYLDPQKTQGAPETMIIDDLLEGLVNQDADGNTIPGVATSWETPDNKIFTFHLRKNAKWSNGDPVTAHDFVYSFQRAVDPERSRGVKSGAGRGGSVSAARWREHPNPPTHTHKHTHAPRIRLLDHGLSGSGWGRTEL